MKRKAFTLLLIALTMMAGAQTQLSGKYKLDRSQSQLHKQFSMAPNEVVIQSTKKAFKVEKHASFQGNAFTISDSYTLDGKECINPGWMDTQKKSTAKWNKKEKKLTVNTKLALQDGQEMTVVEVYHKDGPKLIIDAKASSSFGDMNETMVFIQD